MEHVARGIVAASGVARIFQHGGGGQSEGAKRPSWGRVWEGGIPRPTVGRFFENSCMKTAFSSTLNDIIRGVCEVAYTNLLYIPPPPFQNLFYSN